MNEGNKIWCEHCKTCDSQTAEMILIELLYVAYKTARSRDTIPVEKLDLMFGSNAPELSARYAKERGV